MRILVLITLACMFFQSCSKTNTAPASTNPTTDTPGLSVSLYNPVPLDTVIDWIRIGRVAHNLEDIWFTTKTDGFIASDSSLLVTHDNGTTWSKIPNTANLLLYNLQFIDDQNGFSQGPSVLGITKDGGASWAFEHLPNSSVIYFQFISITTGFFADMIAGIKKTIDAGNQWTSVMTNANQNFPFYFLDSLRGFAMGGGDFSVSTDGGLNWTLKAAHVTTYDQRYYKMQFLDTLTGYCATPTGLLKTTNGGNTWINCLAASTNFMMPYFFDTKNGYCLDRNTIYKTTDGGANWTLSCKLPTDSFSGFHFLDMNTGWACTFGGYMLRLK
ncbi:MAG TPA: hypothetical protein VII28_16640 [Puia sp.]